MRSEPICQFVGLSGEPYAAVLELEHWTEKELKEHVSKCL